MRAGAIYDCGNELDGSNQVGDKGRDGLINRYEVGMSQVRGQAVLDYEGLRGSAKYRPPKLAYLCQMYQRW